MPIRYFVTDRAVPAVSSQQLQQAVAPRVRDMGRRADRANESPSSPGSRPQRRGAVTALTVIGFQNRPELDRTLGATSFIIDTTTGDIVESDIFFNSAFAWSVDPQGDTGAFDLESIALHEIGHLHGLAHSAMGETELRAGGRRVIAAEAVMFPIAFSPGSIAFRTLRADDIAGFPTSTRRRRFHAPDGQRQRQGHEERRWRSRRAHRGVQPENRSAGRRLPLSADGAFVIGGLEPGPHVLRVEPLDDADIDSFLDLTLGVDVDFRVKFYEKVVVVPKGGGTSNIEIKVLPERRRRMRAWGVVTAMYWSCRRGPRPPTRRCGRARMRRGAGRSRSPAG